MLNDYPIAITCFCIILVLLVVSIFNRELGKYLLTVFLLFVFMWFLVQILDDSGIRDEFRGRRTRDPITGIRYFD